MTFPFARFPALLAFAVAAVSPALAFADAGAAAAQARVKALEAECRAHNERVAAGEVVESGVFDPCRELESVKRDAATAPDFELLKEVCGASDGADRVSKDPALLKERAQCLQLRNHLNSKGPFTAEDCNRLLAKEEVAKDKDHAAGRLCAALRKRAEAPDGLAALKADCEATLKRAGPRADRGKIAACKAFDEQSPEALARRASQAQAKRAALCRSFGLPENCDGAALAKKRAAAKPPVAAQTAQRPHLSPDRRAVPNAAVRKPAAAPQNPIASFFQGIRDFFAGLFKGGASLCLTGTDIPCNGAEQCGPCAKRR